MFLESIKWIAIDTETTGINPWENELLEIGAVCFDINGIISRFQALIIPEKEQDPRAKEIHKITDEEIKKHGIPLKEAMEKFLKFIHDSGDFPFIFHNAPFDVSFLYQALQKTNLNIPTNYYYDNFYISKKNFSSRVGHSLKALKEHYGIENFESHRALADAEVTALIFLKSLQEKEITSKKKYNSFLRYHRTFDTFELKLPRNFKKIQNYIDNHIKMGSLFDIYVTNINEGKAVTVTLHGMIKKMLIFNQEIYISFYKVNEDDLELIAIKNIILKDPEHGNIDYEKILSLD